MPRSAAVEQDFFAMAERNSILSRNSSSHGFNPAILPSVFTTGSGVSAANLWSAGPVPVLTMNSNANPRKVSGSPMMRNAPLTIFYNGTVAVFDVNHDAAEKIIKEAEDGSGSDMKKLLLNPHGDLPMARKQSLQRFFEKRKDRLTATAPYASGRGEVGILKERADMNPNPNF